MFVKIISSHLCFIESNGVADSDPHVFGPPGSGSVTVRGMDLNPDAAPDPDPCITKQKSKNLDSYCFVTSF